MLEYWRAQLEGSSPTLNVPIDKARPPVQGYSGASVWFGLGNDVVDGLKSLAAAHHATIFTVLLTAYEILLSRWCNQEDILIGTPMRRLARQWSAPLATKTIPFQP
jgi:hypothetical protein